MNVVQIAADFLDRPLYVRLFNAERKQGVESQVVVPCNADALATDPSIHWNRLFVTTACSKIERVLFFPKQKKVLREIEANLDLHKFDVIHAHTLFSCGYSARKLHQKYGTPYLVAVRNTDVNVFFQYMVPLRKVGIRILRDAEAVIFLSPAYRDRVIENDVPVKLRQQILSKSRVIPNGIDRLFLENRPEARREFPKTIRLLYAGDVDSNKNLETTIEAVKVLQQRGISADLTVVGDILDSSYRGLIEKTPFVHYFTRRPKEQVLEHYRNSDIFVMPSHTETFGLVYAEAMSQGLPVLYTRGQGFDGQFPDGTVGYAVSDCDPAEIADKVQQILANYAQMSLNCIQNAKKYDWEQIAGEYQALYEEVTARTTHHSV